MSYTDRNCLDMHHSPVRLRKLLFSFQSRVRRLLLRVRLRREDILPKAVRRTKEWSRTYDSKQLSCYHLVSTGSIVVSLDHD